jgi:hypothetical protein
MIHEIIQIAFTGLALIALLVVIVFALSKLIEDQDVN